MKKKLDFDKIDEEIKTKTADDTDVDDVKAEFLKQLMLKNIRKRPIFNMRNDNFLENEIIGKIIKPKEFTITWQP